MTNKADQMKATLVEDPGNPVFAEYAEHLRLAGQKMAGMEVCLNGLSLNPDCHKGRLVLARIFYDGNYLPFAVRELQALCVALPENKSVRRLLEKLAPDTKFPSAATSKVEPEGSGSSGAEAKPASETIAETDFSFDDFEMIEEDEKGKK
jgi:hypothetical protein